MLRNLTFVVQFAYFNFRPRAITGPIMALASDPKNVFVFSSNFSATFVTKSNFDCFLSNFLRNHRNLEQLVESLN